MKKEIIVVGRGGQGAKTFAFLLAESAFECGKFIQAFPEYGPERAGAPVKSYLRISDEKILVHSDIEKADVLVVIDKGLINEDILRLIKNDGILLVNSDKKTLFKGKSYFVDASEIAINLFGKDIPNTVLLGAVVKTTGIVPLDKLKAILKKKFIAKFGEEITNKNLLALEQGYKNVK